MRRLEEHLFGTIKTDKRKIHVAEFLVRSGNSIPCLGHKYGYALIDDHDLHVKEKIKESFSWQLNNVFSGYQH